MAAPQSCLSPAKELDIGAKECSFANVEEISVDAECALSLGTDFIHLPCVPPDGSEQDEEGILLAGKYFLPPGFRFHPTDQEIILYYLKRKICGLKMELDIIAEIDLYEFEPWDLHEVSCLQTKDLLWYFFCPKMRKYPKGNRENRATPVGRWKPSGKDRPVLSGSRLVGTRKCLIYYVRRAKKEERTDWVMHEFRLSEDEIQRLKAKQNDFVLSRVFKKDGRGSKRGQSYGVLMEDEEVESYHEMMGNECVFGYPAEDERIACQVDGQDQPGHVYANGFTPSESTESEMKSSVISSKTLFSARGGQSVRMCSRTLRANPMRPNLARHSLSMFVSAVVVRVLPFCNLFLCTQV
ncbi:hypothetical protein GOP47_0018016 [Adiantum capillus-veneris]|uniref:NAC domain-containing protein n=1 Tax=Adiantum capillus-veneris TaxID=13818 RepID=A0A9D4UHE7_ADICA|nr:hypothetical protein GOP47_0018016 [Adiantum capillus-veneris]